MSPESELQVFWFTVILYSGLPVSPVQALKAYTLKKVSNEFLPLPILA